MNQFGKNLRISIFGESHGEYIGLTIDGLPDGLEIPYKDIEKALDLRRGREDISTSRREPDKYKIVSGAFNDSTTGTPLTILIPNVSQDSSFYDEKGIVRPSQSDLTAFYKYHGNNDYRGGGHFSGRITVGLVILGVFCEKILQKSSICVLSHINSIRTTYDKFNADELEKMEALKNIQNEYFPVLDNTSQKLMLEQIKKAEKNDDSVGGTVETFIEGLPIGIGEPFFDSFESILSHLIFSIPGIKGLEFGEGFNISTLPGSLANDQLEFQDDKIIFKTNHSGGINAGITNGNIVTFRTAIRSTPSIGKLLQSINVENKKNIILSTKGHHDPCFVPRALQVINALTKYAVVDLLLESEKHYG